MDEPQLTRSVDDPDTTFSLGQRLRRLLWIPERILSALFLPDRSMRATVNAERAGAAVILCMLCAGASSWVVGSRIDMTSTVLEQEVWRQKWAGPNEESRSDRDINEQIDKDKAIFQVKLGLRAGVWIPLEMGLLALGLYAASRFVGGRPKMKRVFVAAAYSQLPFALKSIAIAALAWNHPILVPTDVEKLRDFADLIIPLRNGGGFHIDFFNVWSHVILIFGLAAAAQISRLRALALVSVKFLVFTLFTGGAPQPRFVKPMMGRGNS